jgi:hypothetical protein
MSPALPRKPKNTITIKDATIIVIGAFREGLDSAFENMPGVTSILLIT